MGYYLVKLLITAFAVVLISEVAKRSSFVGAVLASVPLTSVLAMVWLYVDTGDVGRVSELAGSVFWLVLPSLALFVALPVLLASGVHFYIALALSILITAVCYGVMVLILRYFGIHL